MEAKARDLGCPMVQAWCVCDAPSCLYSLGGGSLYWSRLWVGNSTHHRGGRVKVLQRMHRDLILPLSQTGLQVWSCHWTAAVPNQNWPTWTWQSPMPCPPDLSQPSGKLATRAAWPSYYHPSFPHGSNFLFPSSASTSKCDQLGSQKGAPAQGFGGGGCCSTEQESREVRHELVPKGFL